MLVLRANPRGGRPIRAGHFPLHQDQEGNFGYLIGYSGPCPNCHRGGGDKQLIPLSLANQIANQLGSNSSGLTSLLSKFKPSIPLKERVAIWLLGKQKTRELKEELAEGD